MIDLVLSSVYFFLPAYFANMAPVFARLLGLPGGTISADLFGAHKTYRGLYAGVIGALLALAMQHALQVAGIFESFRIISYDWACVLALAPLFGLGAIGGDMLKSFAKRRLGIASGRPWVPFDEIDFILGSAALVAFFYPFPMSVFWCGLIVTPVLHFATNIFAYMTGLKEVWW